MRPSRRREEGGIALMVALMTSVLAALVLVVLHAGKLVIAQQELTSVADAAALTGAAVLRQHGSAGNDVLDLSAHMSLLRDMNTSLPAEARVSVVRDLENDDRVFVRADVTGNYTNPFALLGRRAFRLHAVSHAVINEWGRDTRWPIMVLMVDASASMGRPVNDRFRWPWESRSPEESKTFYDLLTELIADYLKLPFPVRTGLVVFGADVLATEPPPATNVSNVAQIRAKMESVAPTSNCTNYEKALNEAAQMVERPQDAVILITDGQPTCGGTFDRLPWGIGSPFWEDHHEAAYKAGSALREGGAIYTVETQGRDARGFLTGIAGGAGDPDGGDDEFYYGVSSLEDIARFRAAMARITCMFGPLPETTATGWCSNNAVGAFLYDTDGEEEALERIATAEVDTSTDDHSFACRQTDVGAYIQLSPPTCYRMTAVDNRVLLVRWGGARLTCPPEARTLVECLGG